jgi:predicted N-acetyltransferase YhbS
MDWQQFVSLFIVASAAILLLGHKFRRQRFGFQRAAHCGCSAIPVSAPPPSILFRARKGHRPEVRVKMR